MFLFLCHTTPPLSFFIIIIPNLLKALSLPVACPALLGMGVSVLYRCQRLRLTCKRATLSVELSACLGRIIPTTKLGLEFTVVEAKASALVDTMLPLEPMLRAILTQPQCNFPATIT